MRSCESGKLSALNKSEALSFNLEVPEILIYAALNLVKAIKSEIRNLSLKSISFYVSITGTTKAFIISYVVLTDF